jgi:hypothetical protein
MIPVSHDSQRSILNAVVSHIAQAKANNLWQFREAPNIELLLEIVLSRLDRVQQDVIDLQEELSIERATGAILDLLGTRVGRERGDLADDEDYREAIITQILENTNSGTIHEILIILHRKAGLEYDPDPNLFITELFPARVAVVIPDDKVEVLGGEEGIDSLFSAGVGSNLHVFPPDCIPFGFVGSGALGLNEGCFVAAYVTGPNKDIVPFSLDSDVNGGQGLDAHGSENQGQFVTNQDSLRFQCVPH